MKIALACDHGGYAFKTKLHEWLEKKGHTVEDFGCDSEESCDYPDYAIPAVQSVVDKKSERAILICSNGLGMCIVGNKFQGILAALVYSEKTAAVTRKHHDSKVLCLGGKEFEEEKLFRFVEIWLNTEFEGGRHARRVNKIKALEKTNTE